MADNKISSSKKEIYTKLLNIAGKYTDIEDGDFLKTGLFGYITESMAMMMRDSTFHKSMIYNESMLNTAIIPKTVYNWAKTFNIEVQKANPSYADIEIIIPVSSLESYINKYKVDTNKFTIINEETDKFLILDKEDPILAGEYYFSLEHSILIKRKTSSTSSTYYQARYLTSKEEYQSTNFQTIKSKKLDVRNNYIYNNETNIVIKARAYQYKKTIFTRQISSNSFLNKIQRFEFEDQFCGAKLFYKENGKDLELGLLYSDIVKSSSNSAFYNLNDSNELEIKFKSGSNYFTPAANTVLKIIIYSTKGKAVPDSFKGDALILFSKSDMKSLPVIVHFNPTAIIGGKDAPTIDEIKETIINEISTRKTISTKTDLNTYFNILTMLVQSINNGKVTFTKKRDDIIKRVYNSYLLIRDMTDDSTTDNASSSSVLSACVPTNTIDVMLKNNSEYFKTTTKGTIEYTYPTFVYNIVTQQYENENPTNEDYYICPFTIFISSNPIRYTKYIYNLTDSSSTLSYDDENNEEGEFQEEQYIIPISVALYRGFTETVNAEDKYTLTLTFSTDFALGSCDDNSKTVLTPAGNIKINNIPIKVESSNCRSVVIDDSTFTTTIELTLQIGNEEFNFDDNQASKIQIKNGTSEVSFDSSNRIKVDFSEFMIDSKTVGGAFISDEKLVFFQQLDDIMDSTLITIPLDADGKEISNDKKETTAIASYKVGIKEVPVIHKSFFSNTADTTARKEGFIKQLFTYINILKENNSKLETSTFFNLKFYNTYGPSKFYDTINTNLDLRMNISLDKSYNTVDYDNLKTEIKSYIRKSIDKMNEKEQFSISSIISLLLDSNTYGKYITYIQFIGLNDSFNQVITKNEEINEADYPPEWINIQPGMLEHITFEDISRSNI